MTVEEINNRLDELDEVPIMTTEQTIEYSKLIKMLQEIKKEYGRGAITW